MQDSPKNKTRSRKTPAKGQLDGNKRVHELTVTAAVLGEWLGLSVERVRQLETAGVLAKAERGNWPLKPNVQAYCKFTRDRKVMRSGDEPAGTAENAKGRKTQAEAEIRQIELEILRGDRLLRSDVEQTWERVCAVLRTVLLTIPAKAAPLVEGRTPAECQAILLDAINEALGVLHETNIEIDAHST